jgi:hypothetical protein
LAEHLGGAGHQQFPESDWLVGRLREAVGAWEGLVERSVLVVLRQPVGGLVSVSDEELMASLDAIPSWLSDENKGTGEQGVEAERPPV